MHPTLYTTLFTGLLLVFVNQTSSFTIKPKLNCSGVPADIVFVLDSSSSIWGPHFQKQLDFVTYLVNQLDIGMGPEQVRVGVEIFSDSAHVKVNLDESVDKETLKRKIVGISRLLGDTNTADALNQLKDTMFKPEQGSRPGVKRIAFILTDGASKDKAATQVAAKECRDANIQLFAIGIGHSISLSELMGIASKPTDKFLIRAPSYETLDRIRKDVAQRTCHAVVTHQSTTTRPVTTESIPTTVPTTLIPTTTTTLKPTTEELIPADQAERACRNKIADVFFLLDSSSSISIVEFKKQINTIENIVDKFNIGSDKTRVGVSVFTHEYNPVLSFDTGADKAKAMKEIHNINYMGGATKTGNALYQVRSHVFNNASIRPGAERILIVFTDGMSIDYERTSTEATLLHDSGVKIFAVGVGQDVDQMELQDIASQPSNEFLHNFDTFDILLAKSEVLTYKACTVNDQALEKDKNACKIAQPTDVVFMVNNNRFGQEKTNQILKASAGVIKVVGNNGVFRYGTIFDDCPPTKDIAIGSITDESQLISEIVNFKYSSLSSLLEKLQHSKFPSGSSNTRQVGVLFLDNTIDLKDPQIFAQARRAHFENIQLYVVVIGNGVDISRVQNVLVPKERIISVYSYETLQSYLPSMFAKRICIPVQKHEGRKPSLA